MFIGDGPTNRTKLHTTLQRAPSRRRWRATHAVIMAAKKAQQQAMDMLQANYASVVGLLEKSEAERKQALADVELSLIHI